MGHFLSRQCLLKHVIKGKVEGIRIWEEIHERLQDDLRQRRSYSNFKKEYNVAVGAERVLEGAKDLSQNRLRLEQIISSFKIDPCNLLLLLSKLKINWNLNAILFLTHITASKRQSIFHNV